MIDDARKLSSGTVMDCDLCIVGSGVAGITLSLEMARAGWDVILLEAGKLNKSGRSLNLYQGEVVNPEHHLPLDSDRYRQLGGTTGLWGGRCVPFDPIDFEKRDYVPYSGWPFGWDELERYYRAAHIYCECGDFSYYTAMALPDALPEMVPGFKDGDLVASKIERWSPPTHFGKRYRAELKTSDNIKVLLNAVCIKLEQTPDGTSVKRLVIGTFGGKKLYVKAKIAVLAGGGLEVARLLLTSNDVQRDGIGNHSDWLGRGYQCHISGVTARVRFKTNVHIIYGYERDREGIYCRRRFWISEEAQRRYKLPNIHMLLDRPLLEDPRHGNALLSLAYLTKRVVSKSLQPVSVKGKYGLYWRHFKNILAGSPEIFLVLPKWSRERFIQDRRVPSLLLASEDNTYDFYYHTEQIPSRDSRVTLSRERDVFGVPRLRVDFRVDDIDVDRIIRAHELVGRELRRQGCGDLHFISDDPRALIKQHQGTLGHHIGTTRMAADPSRGVVDENCRIHGVSNLFIASSSVFPTSSQAGPTLTIVAMTIRLGEHLKTLGCSSSISA